MEIRTAVVGIGNIGTAHATALRDHLIEGMSLAAVCDINEERLHAAETQFPDAKRYSCIDDLLKDESVEAVIISTPHPFHAELAVQALRSGRHVLVEKPIDIRLSQAKRLCDAAKESECKFAIMLNQRTDPIFRRAREIVRSGALGALKRSVWIITNWYRTQHYYDSGSWRATWAGEGGGVLLNQAPHNMDLWQWIVGMPTHVRGFCDVAKYHRIEVEDEATLMTRYPGGATGLFITTTGEYPGTNRLEISGELGKIVIENGILTHWRLEQNEREIRFASVENFAKIPYTVETFAPGEPGDGHIGILINFSDAIRNGAELISPGQDGVNELTLSNAAYLSSWEGNIEIALPIDNDRFNALLDERVSQSTGIKTTAKSKIPTGSYSERWQVKW
ncbi:MAG: Gfo/Idh/MocA family oxidoreductase [Clostridia bacterium]|nr:Gfo/Idh/MocA family oxidoreductase [Clostridia bacterium]